MSATCSNTESFLLRNEADMSEGGNTCEDDGNAMVVTWVIHNSVQDLHFIHFVVEYCKVECSSLCWVFSCIDLVSDFIVTLYFIQCLCTVLRK